MKPFALLFAGQGAQQVGMGLPVLEQTPALKSYFASLQKSLHFDLTGILNGSIQGLNQTEYTQPALLATSLLYYQQLQTLFPINPAYLLGFSLGEYTALHVAGHLDLPTTLSLIQLRAKAMAEASLANPGGMAAIIGLAPETLKALCVQVSKPGHQVIIANYNSPGQLVISGHHEAVKAVMTLALNGGAKRAIALNVSGAFHSPLMEPASLAIAKALRAVRFHPATMPMIFNWTAQPLPNLNALADHLIQQVKSSVLFDDSIRYLSGRGIHTFLEIGPGNVLAGLVKKILPEASVVSYNGQADLEQVKELLS